MRADSPGKLLIAGTFALLSVVTPLADAAQTKIVGFDDMSCKAWTASKSDEELRKSYIAWVRGVLTGHNYANPAQQISVVSAGTVENFVDRYCTEKPKGDFSEAALRMTDTFSGRNEPIKR